jgi:hypothetical protein
VQLAIVFAPIHPAYRAALPQSMAELKRAIGEIQKRVSDENTFMLDLHASAQFGPHDFYDAFHLVWSGAQTLSDLIVTDLEHLHTDNAMATHGQAPATPHSNKAP